MTAPTPPAPPSWRPPILAGVSLGLLAALATWVMAGRVPASAMACCCALQLLPLGVAPAWLAWLGDRGTTVGQGFAVSFIAVGIVSVAAAALAVPASRSMDRDKMHADLVEQMQDINSKAPADQRLSEDELRQRADDLIRFVPYAPIVIAFAATVIAGLIGAITTGILARSRRAKMPPSSALP